MIISYNNAQLGHVTRLPYLLAAEGRHKYKIFKNLDTFIALFVLISSKFDKDMTGIHIQ